MKFFKLSFTKKIVMNKKIVIYLLLFGLFFSCSKDNNTPSPDEPDLLKVSVVNGEFKDSENREFFPWGLNYTNPAGVGLIEDNWLDDNVWRTIQSDFLEMKEIGANIVRIHLQYHQFMMDADTPNEANLNRLKELVDYAESNHLYLDITGLAAYRKSDQPSFYQDMTDEERWSTQALFWEYIANKVGASPAVFAFNLMNEPVVSVGCDGTSNCEWLPGAGFGGFHFVQNITRTPGEVYALTMKAWMSKITQSIRSKDMETLITVGFLDLGNYSRFSTDLDYLSPHIYPTSGEIDVSINKLIDNQSNVPIVIEEISNLNCNIMELEEFLRGVEGNYGGLMGHYFGTPITDLDENEIIQAIQKNFLQFFEANNPN